MDFIFYQGTEETAPVCIAMVGVAPAWQGKDRAELTKSDMDKMLEFCIREGKKIGYEDYCLGRTVLRNPFHRRFLHGMPHFYCTSGRGSSRRFSASMPIKRISKGSGLASPDHSIRSSKALQARRRPRP